MSKEVKKAFEHLFNDVIKPRLCIGCGACIASCQFDVLDITNHEPKLVGKCARCGFCYYECPQVGDLDKLKKRVFGRASGNPNSYSIGVVRSVEDQIYKDPDIGIYREALSVKTKDSEIQKSCQDGGAVTSILVSLLEQGFIDGAVVMGFGDEPWKPKPKVALTRDELIECAGTKYTSGPILLGLKEAVDLFLKERLAIVGTPCQIKAARRMQFDDKAFYHLADFVKLTIGLFCMESFDYGKFKRFVEEKMKIPLQDVSKFDIKKGNLIVYSERLKREVGVGALKGCVNTPCLVCPDFSSELADVSIGAVGSPLGSSTVLVRTKIGAEAFDIVRKSEKLDVKSLDLVKPGIGLIKRLSKRKKDLAEKELERRSESGKPIPPWLKEKVKAKRS